MAKIVNNDKGFKVISLSTREAQVLGFGIEGSGACICMHCNNIIKGDIYYIAVLNDTMDKECYDEWYKGAKRYTEDIPVEDRNFKNVKEALEMEFLIRCTNVGLR